MNSNLYNPNDIIVNLEKYSIIPFQYLCPVLGVIIRENAPEDEQSYLRSLILKADAYGAEIQVVEVSAMCDAALAIQEMREKHEISGIIILSSFGKDADRVLANMIPVRLDIDCISSTCLGQLITNTSPIGFRIGPCTAIACYKIIEDVLETDSFEGYNIAIINRSLRVGRPLAEILTQHNATVTCFHSKSPELNLADFDIIVSAVGIPEFINEYSFIEEQDVATSLVIDVAINSTKNGLVGDVAPELYNMYPGITFTKVPGGVGRIVPIVLFAKLFQNAALMQGEEIGAM